MVSGILDVKAKYKIRRQSQQFDNIGLDNIEDEDKTPEKQPEDKVSDGTNVSQYSPNK